MSRKRTGTLVWTGKTWGIQVRIGGERKWYNLDTDSKSVAERKRDKLIADLEKGDEPADTRGEETVEGYARPWLEARKRRNLATADSERRFYDRVWQPVIGQLRLKQVRAGHIRPVLEAAAAGEVTWKGKDGTERTYGKQSLVHMRAAVFRLFQSAWRDELVDSNPVERVEVPDVEVDEERKARAVLTDTEIACLVSNPEGDAEVKVLVLLSRTIGGLRAGDLNALDWTSFGPDFATCTFVRRKTRRKKPRRQTMEVPAPVRPFLRAWWERAGKPAEGPVFPVRKGERAGQAKKAANMSYAKRLRRELLKAGVDRHELHRETATTKPVDFHSTRRAYASSLARVGVNEQTAMLLTGHSNSDVHRRYLEDQAVLSVPAAAVPFLDEGTAGQLLRKAKVLAIAPPALSGISNDSSAEGQTRTADLALMKPASVAKPAKNRPEDASAGLHDPRGSALPLPLAFAIRARLADLAIGKLLAAVYPLGGISDAEFEERLAVSRIGGAGELSQETAARATASLKRALEASPASASAKHSEPVPA